MPHLRPITRRQGLLATVALVPLGFIAACSGDDEGAPTGGAVPTDGSADSAPADAQTVTAEVAGDEADLLALYDAALAALPEGDGRREIVSGIRDQHAAHLEALAATPSKTAPANLPADADAVIALLARAERQAARSRIRACEATEDAALARLLVFIAASESAHAAELREVRS